MARYPGFVGPSYTSQSSLAADDELYNRYIEKIESGTGPASYVFYPTLGADAYCTLASSPGRGTFTLNGATFAVADDDLYLLPFVSGGSATLLDSGLNNPDDSPVTIAGNGDGGRQLMITAGSKLYVYDIPTTAITEIHGITATFVVFLDGYFVALDPNTSTIYLSAIEDGSSWDLLDVAQRNDAPDKWIAMVASHKELWLFGSQTTSVWYNSGAAEFPFQPNPSVFIPKGIVAPNSAALIDGSPIWLGQGIDGAGVVYRAQGYSPERVSTHALEYQLSTYSTLSDAEATVYQWQGHVFYELTFPTAGVTWVYDATVGLWHKEGEWNGLTYDPNPYRSHASANGVLIFADRTSGTIWQRSTEFATDTSGEGLRWMRRAPHLTQELKRIRYDWLQLHMEVGTGLPSISGNPTAAPTAESADGAGITAGDHYWAKTFITAEGESVAGPISDVVDVGGLIADPDTALSGSYTSLGDGGPYPFTAGDAPRSWAYTWLTTYGETLPSPLYDPMNGAVIGPGGPYYFNAVLPIGGNSVIGKNLYRTVAGGAQLKLVGTMANAVTDFADHIADGDLGADAPIVSDATVGNQVVVSSSERGPAQTIAHGLYRTVASGSQLKLVTTISGNAAWEYTDSTPDGSLGANSPTTNTSGLADHNGAATSLMLRFSDDGGHTWSGITTASTGPIGAYQTRVIWRRLGMGRDRVFEISGSDPVPFRIVDCYLHMRVGAS